MLKNILWISAIIVLLGIVLFVIAVIYEKNKGASERKNCFQYFILDFIIVTVIAVGLFIYINNRELFEYKKIKEEPIPVKEVQSYIDNKEYDRCVAYAYLIRYHTLLDLDLISEADEKTLAAAYKNKENKPVYNIAFVQKGNGDYIKIVNSEKPKDNYLFKSNLPYSFNDLLGLFEEASNSQVSDAFLNGKDSGIFFTKISKNLDAQFVYITEINGHKYIAYYDDELIILE